MPNFVEYARNDLYSITSHFFPTCLFFFYSSIMQPSLCLFLYQGKGRLRGSGQQLRQRQGQKSTLHVCERRQTQEHWDVCTYVSLDCLCFSILTNQCNHNKHLQHSDFINLLDNYEMSTGVSETVTSEELQENRLFIDSIMKTDVMKVQ